MEMYKIPFHDYIKINWIDLYPQNDTGYNSDLQLLCSTCHICMIDWCDEEYDFCPQTSTFHQHKRNGWKMKSLEGLQKVHSNWFGSILCGIKNEKEREKQSMSLGLLFA